MMASPSPSLATVAPSVSRVTEEEGEVDVTLARDGTLEIVLLGLPATECKYGWIMGAVSDLAVGEDEAGAAEELEVPLP